MADKEISDLTDGGAAASGDVVHAFRSPNSRKVTLGNLAGLNSAITTKGAAIASAGTISVGADGFYHVTGTTTITDIDFTAPLDGRMVWLEFDGALTLTHNATTLNLPGGANIVTAAGDRALFVQDSSDNVHCLVYVRASGAAINSGAPDVILEDQKSSGTGGGGITAGSDAVRTLNTEVHDPRGLCSLSSNQFTLQPGTWYIEWSAPSASTGMHQSMLYDVTGAATLKRGAQINTSALTTRSDGQAVVTIASANAFEIRHRVTTNNGGADGLGGAASFGTEIYTVVKCWKQA